MRRKFLSFIIFLSSLFSLEHVCAEEFRAFGGVSRAKLPGGLILTVTTEKDFDFVEDEIELRFYKTKIELKREKEVLWSEVHKQSEEPLWTYADIVPIRKERYFEDLDRDGTFEVAILPWHFGNASFWSARIYSVVDNRLIPFGTGRYNLERGPNVLLGCPKCWKFDLSECKKCY